MMTPLRDWENPLVTGINKRPGHVPMGAYPDAELALAHEPEQVDQVQRALRPDLGPVLDRVRHGEQPA